MRHGNAAGLGTIVLLMYEFLASFLDFNFIFYLFIFLTERLELQNDLNIGTPPSDTVAEAASGADSVLRETVTPTPRKIGRTDPYEGEARVSKSTTVEAVRRFHCDETVSCEKMTEYLAMSNGGGGGGAAIDLNLSLSLFSR